ncbi:hypothetical protein [uncultured Thiohalocapsa sp.]|uniref:hypothetical protein n=1 Tax=uncultured Thiohalocapsa sp. TaxID=768990 RepID=UPI0025F0F3BB|nr:hypothetical protein [uncultured Thiohalocapsa sp.]
MRAIAKRWHERSGIHNRNGNLGFAAVRHPNPLICVLHCGNERGKAITARLPDR